METKNYNDQKVMPFLSIPLTMLDNKEFMKWINTFEFKLWCKMFRHIIRGNMTSKINKYIYNTYYENGKLVMYKSQKEMAEFFDASTIGYISRAIQGMINKGIIIPRKDSFNNRSITMYELGFHDKNYCKHENLYAFIYFTKLQAEMELENDLV
jgi:hypothetical protein